MANRFSLEADIQPTVDDRAAQQQADELGETFEESIGDLSPGVDGDFDSFMSQNGGGGGGGVGAGTAGGFGALGGALRGGTGALLPVALAGATGFGILAGVQRLAQASPALGMVSNMFGEAMDLFFRPFGDWVAGFLRPAAEGMLDFSVQFNRIVDNQGLAVGLAYVGNSAVETLAGGITNSFEDIISGEGDVLDFLVAGGATITAAKIIGAIGWPSITGGALLGAVSWPTITGAGIVGAVSWPLIGAAAITGAMTWGSFKSGDLVAAMGWGTLTGALVAGALGFGTVTGGLIVGGLSFGAVTGGMVLNEIGWPTITASQLIAGFVEAGGNVEIGDGGGDGPWWKDALGNIPITPGLPFAEGGVVRGRTTATIGEAGPEAVMPLDDLSREISRAMRQALRSADTGGSADMGRVEDRLDTLISEMQRLRQTMNDQDVTVELPKDKQRDPW